MRAFSAAVRRLWVPVWFAPRAYLALAAIAALLAAGALAQPLLLIALCAAAIFAAGLAFDAGAAPRLTEIVVERAPPEPFSLRRPGVIAYRVANRSRFPARIALIEAPVSLLHYDLDELVIAAGAQSEAFVERPVTPVARGTATLRATYLWYEGRFALLRRRMRFERPAEFRVFPDLSAVERYGSLHVRNKLVEAGLRRMRLRGVGTEPESVREWSPGDPFRSIDWKATARRGKMMVAQYEVERSQNVMILLDVGRLMTPRVGAQRKFDYAITAALSVASIASLASDKVGVVAFAGSIVRAFAPRRTGRSSARIAQELYDLEPRFEESDYENAFAYVRAHVSKRSLAILFTDMLDPVAQSTVLAAIGALCKRHVVVCAFMNDAAIANALDADPDRAGQAYAAAVALELREERRLAVASLARLGVRVVDVPAAQLTTALIDRYLLIKQRGLL